MSYIEPYVQSIREECDLYHIDEQQLVIMYALLAMTKGKDTTEQDVHDAWSLWTHYNRGLFTHKSIVPFDELSQRVKDYDTPYKNAIIRTAQKVNGNESG